MYIPLFGNNQNLSVGSYRFDFNLADSTPETIRNNMPIIVNPKTISVAGKTISLVKTEYRAELGTFHVYIDILSNPIPIAYLIMALLTVTGLAITYLIFDKVLTLVDDSKILIVLISVIVFFYLIFVKFRKQ